ncbi:MAG: DUF92 domain-containing protein, partial [Candidatus Eremiobacteraeota bacterium]|nr:DUF92 domain-containing protein [Candidatus Eremiobacteraeota bacterium]
LTGPNLDLLRSVCAATDRPVVASGGVSSLDDLHAIAAVAGVAIAGIAGASLDSLLGAAAQELRRCTACKRTCETNPHACGRPTVLVRGVPGFSNDAVNFAASFAGAATALALGAAAGI